MVTPRSLSLAELTEGMSHARDYTITPEVYRHFLAAFDDRSPIHVDAAAARARGFPDLVMHGGILNGFVSHFVGMEFPGAHSLLLSTELRFSHPTHLGDTLRLEARVERIVVSQQVVLLHVRFLNLNRENLAATGRVQVRISPA